MREFATGFSFVACRNFARPQVILDSIWANLEDPIVLVQGREVDTRKGEVDFGLLGQAVSTKIWHVVAHWRCLYHPPPRPVLLLMVQRTTSNVVRYTSRKAARKSLYILAQVKSTHHASILW